jgi:4-amino-4-deoxy-L-arabinose transferase-like glycosyltransferase
MVRLLQQPDRLLQWAILGLLIALGVLTKLSGVVPGLLALILLVVCALRQRSLRLFGRGLLALGVPVVLLTGWWFVRNQVLYGDPMAWQLYKQVFAANLRYAPLTTADVRPFFTTQFRSFLGVFGWMNVAVPEWYYSAATILGLAGLFGLLLLLLLPRRSHLSRLQKDVLVGMVLAVLAQEAYVVATLTQCNASCYQGRYMFPVIAPLMLLLAFGLLNLVRGWGQGLLTGALALVLVAGALYMPLRVIAPAYAAVPQPKVSLWLMPHKTDVMFGDLIRLRGYDAQVVSNGSEIKLTLYWQAIKKPDFNYSAFAHLLDASGQVISQQDHAPGEDRGYPPTFWSPDDIVADVHTLSLPAGQNLGGYRYRVGLYNWSTGQQLPALAPDQPAANFVIFDSTIH